MWFLTPQVPAFLRYTAQEWGPSDQEPPPLLAFFQTQTHAHTHTCTHACPMHSLKPLLPVPQRALESLNLKTPAPALPLQPWQPVRALWTLPCSPGPRLSPKWSWAVRHSWGPPEWLAP